jgi:protein-tyrosine phosphatase
VLGLRRFRRGGREPIFWLTSDLAIGPAPQAGDWTRIRVAGFRVTLDLLQEDEKGLTPDQGLEERRFPIREGYAPTAAELAEIGRWVAERIQTDGPVLVYCREGRGRSALVACAALLQLGFGLREAYQLLLRARPEAQLSEVQASRLEELALALALSA